MTFGSGEIDPSQSLGGTGTPVRTASAPAQNQVTFSRRELNRILDLYGRKVAAGEWRDYGREDTICMAVRYDRRVRAAHSLHQFYEPEYCPQ